MITTVKIGQYVFEGFSIIKGSGTLTKSMVADTLSADTMTFKVYSPNADIRLYGSEPAAFFDSDLTPLYVRNADEGLADIPRGTKALIERADATTLGMYVDYIELNDIGIYTLHLTSAVGMLSSMTHYGGMYVAETWGEVCAEIMDATLTAQDASQKEYTSSFGWKYFVPLEIDALVVNNRLKVNSRRENLRQLMFPYGVSLMVSGDSEGDLQFTYNEPDTATVIPDTEVGIGGGSKTPSTVTNITVTEHSYSQTNPEAETLYEDLSRDVDNLLIIFEDAFYDLTATPASGFSFVINESNCNYAKVTGRGTLTGKRYTHYTATYQMGTGKTGVTNDVNFNDMTLVSPLNSTNTINRLVNYFANATFLNRKILINKLKCGDIVNITAPITKEKVNAYVQTLSPNYSSTLYGMAKLVANWTPKYLGNNFDAYLIVTDEDIVNGVWTPPAELVGQTVKMVAFSGAQGGQGGYAGEGGYQTWGGGVGWVDDDSAYGLPSGLVEGGNGGAGGQGGSSAAKKIEALITLQATHSVSLGAGGMGGAGAVVSINTRTNEQTVTPPQLGALGAHTTFDSYDTDNGEDFAGTYINLITGETITEKGDTGIAGGKGGTGGKSIAWVGFSTQAERNAFSFADEGQGQQGASVGNNIGGLGAVGVNGSAAYVWNSFGYFCCGGGGGGGGAAAGANGGNGSTSYVYSHNYRSSDNVSIKEICANRVTVIDYENPQRNVQGARGGQGATAVTVPPQALLRGGTGGAGGGGGGGSGAGCGGTYTHSTSGTWTDYYNGACQVGYSGGGGQGGQGSNGFVVIYYKEQ